MVDEKKESHAKKVLDAIEAVIEKRAGQDQSSYTINGRTLNKTPIRDLLKLRQVYLREYEKELEYEKLINGGKVSKTIRFNLIRPW